MKKLSTLIIILLLSLLLAALLSSCMKTDADINPKLDTKKQVVLTLVGSDAEFKAMETIAAKFNEKYPNCRVVYEYIQDYSNNLVTRLESKTDVADLFITTNIQSDSVNLPYALELFSQSETLDLSNTFEGLIQNFTYKSAESGNAAEIYAIPLGAEIRGMYVNKTLLNKLGLDVPNNRAELLAVCEKLLANGYIPIQGNPSGASIYLMYPYICNLIANAENYDELYNKINSNPAGVSEIFREPMQFLYNLVKEGYYNYKYVENTYNTFSNASEEVMVNSFFNITSDDGEPRKADDVGIVPFMTGTMSNGLAMKKAKEDYHSNIEYEFILAPVGEENGGYAYISPTSGIAVNKNSSNTDWALEFLDFLFKEENNIQFAKEYNVTPNTKNAFDVIKETFEIPDNHISQLGSVTFDYDFYRIFFKALMDISKANAQKYMIDNGDGTYSMYDFEYYMDDLESRFAEQRVQQ